MRLTLALAITSRTLTHTEEHMSKKISKSKTSKSTRQINKEANGGHIYLTLVELASLSQIPLATLEKASKSNDKATSLYAYKRSDGTTMSHPVCVLRFAHKTSTPLSDKGRNALLKVCENTDWGKRYLANVNRKSVTVQVKAQAKKEKKAQAKKVVAAPSKTTNGQAVIASK